MGQEIDRARALLAAVTREGAVPAPEATAAYERWVAEEGDTPFSRFLVRTRPGEAERVRHLLRLQAVQGLPRPELHTIERFEDLLLGQLGIEAGLLSAKLLQTVRAVQDKKLEEGKLRRLDELLPRAGFDEKSLRLLRHHLAERVLLCRGCLGRYPRRERGPLSVECPRCGAPIVAPACMPSDVQLVLSAEQQQQLEASTESEASGVFETLTVAARERERPERAATKGGGAGRTFALLLGALALVGAGVVAVSSRPAPPRRPPPPPPRPATSPRPATEPAEPGPAGGTLEEARVLDRKLTPSGKWTELLDVWRHAVVAGGDAAGKAERERRVAELERLVALAAEATELLAKLREREDPAVEARLAAILDATPSRGPPFGEVQDALEQRGEARRKAARAEAQRRVEAARAATRPSGDVWAARLAQARRGPPLLGLEVGGRAVDGLVVEALDATGFTLKLPDGTTRALRWDDDPPLALAVSERAERPGEQADALERVRRALAARAPRAAAAAIAALGLPGPAPDVAAILSGAPTSAAPVALEGGGHRLRWPTRWVPHDLVAARPLAARPEGGLVLAGERPQVATGAVDVGAAEGARVAAGARLEAGATSPFLAVDLLGGRARRSYVARWDDAGWTLEVDLGAGSNVLKRGPLAGGARAARLEVTAAEVVLLLDGAERARAPTTSRFERVAVRAGAAQGPLVLLELTLEGALDPAWVARTSAAWAGRVDAYVDGLGRQLALRQLSALPRLSVEDPRALAGVEPAAQERLAAARAALAAGRTEEAADALRGLAADAPGYLAARHTRGLVAVLEGDLATAIATLAPAATPAFPEAQALLALALARAGRGERAAELATAALDAQPDLVHALAARARLALEARDLTAPLEADAVLTALALPLALGPDDPLLRDEERLARRALRLDGLARARVAGASCVVLGDGPEEAPAADLAKTLDTLATRFDRALKRKGEARPLLAVRLDPAPLAALLGRDADAAWDRASGAVLVKAGATGVGWDLALAAAEGHVARWYGAPPAWLEAGLALWLAAPAAGADPPGLREALTSSPGWDPAAWRGLFELERAALRSNPLARAKAWGLVTLMTRQAPTLTLLTALLERSARGEPAPWPADAPLDLKALDAQVQAAVKKR